MGENNLWMICLLGLCMSTLVNVNGEDTGNCWICKRTTSSEECKNNNPKFYHNYPVDQELCGNLNRDEVLRKKLCVDYPNGPKIFCELYTTFLEFSCTLICPTETVTKASAISSGTVLLTNINKGIVATTLTIVTVFLSIL